MKVQAEMILKNPDVSELRVVADQLIDTAMRGRGEPNMDDVYMLVVVRTPSPRQSPIDLPITTPQALSRLED